MKCEGFVVHYALGGMIDALDGEQRAAVLGAAYAKARGKNDYKLPDKWAYLQFVVEGIVKQSQKLNESINDRKTQDAERQRKARQRKKHENETNDDYESMKSRNARKTDRAERVTRDRSGIAKNDTDYEVNYENEEDVTRTQCDTEKCHKASQASRGRGVTSGGVTRTQCDAEVCHNASALKKERNKEIKKEIYIPQTPKGVLMDFDEDESDREETLDGRGQGGDAGGDDTPGLRRAHRKERRAHRTEGGDEDRAGGYEEGDGQSEDAWQGNPNVADIRRHPRSISGEAEGGDEDRAGGYEEEDGQGGDAGEWEDEVSEIAAEIVARHGNKSGADGFRRSLKRYLTKNPATDIGEISAAHEKWCKSGAWNPGYEPKLKNWLWGGEWKHEPPEKKKAAAKAAEEDEFYTGASL